MSTSLEAFYIRVQMDRLPSLCLTFFSAASPHHPTVSHSLSLPLSWQLRLSLGRRTSLPRGPPLTAPGTLLPVPRLSVPALAHFPTPKAPLASTRRSSCKPPAPSITRPGNPGEPQALSNWCYIEAGRLVFSRPGLGGIRWELRLCLQWPQQQQQQQG